MRNEIQWPRKFNHIISYTWATCMTFSLQLDFVLEEFTLQDMWCLGIFGKIGTTLINYNVKPNPMDTKLQPHNKRYMGNMYDHFHFNWTLLCLGFGHILLQVIFWVLSLKCGTTLIDKYYMKQNSMATKLEPPNKRNMHGHFHFNWYLFRRCSPYNICMFGYFW